MVEYDRKKFVEILEKIKNTYSSLNEMARKSNVTSSYLSKIISSKYEEPPSPKILKNIAENSHNITSYMDLMYVCGYIDNKDIFEHYNKVFNTSNVSKAVDECDIFNAEEIKNSAMNYLYDRIKDMPEEKQEMFFITINKKSDTIQKNMIKQIKQDIIEDSKKIPIIYNLKQDMLTIKNKKIKFIDDKENIKPFTFFSNEYLKKEYDYICIIAKDNSMNLKIKKNDIILIQLQETLKNGDIGIIEVNNELFTRKYYKENEYIILETLSNNEDYETKIYNTKQDKIKIFGKAIAYQNKI